MKKTILKQKTAKILSSFATIALVATTVMPNFVSADSLSQNNADSIVIEDSFSDNKETDDSILMITETTPEEQPQTTESQEIVTAPDQEEDSLSLEIEDGSIKEETIPESSGAKVIIETFPNITPYKELEGITQSEPKVEVVDGDKLSFRSNLFMAGEIEIPDASQFLTEEEAIASIKDTLLNKRANIKVPVKTDKDIAMDPFFNSLVLAAVEHTGKDTEGDYLHYGTYVTMVAPKGANVTQKIHELNPDDTMSYYIFSTDEIIYFLTQAEEDELTASLNELVGVIINPEDTEYEIVEKIHSYISENVVYDNEHPSPYPRKHTAYAAQFDGKAVCQGYALLFYRLCLLSGVDCRIISGKPENSDVDHMWNIVKIGDKYYYVDETWDAQRRQEGKSDEYFLRGSNNFSGHIPKEEYTYTQFTTKFPISEEDYVENGTTIHIVLKPEDGIIVREYDPADPDSISHSMEFFFEYEGVPGKNAKWSSSDESVAVISETGELKIVGVGETVVSVKDDEGNTDSVLLHVTQKEVEIAPITSITSDVSEITINIDEEMELPITIEPLGDNVEKPIWASSDSNIVTVDPLGNIKGIAPGTTTVNARSAYTEASKIFTITVRSASGDEPGGDTPGGDEPGGEVPGGDEPGGDEPGGEIPGGDEPGGEIGQYSAFAGITEGGRIVINGEEYSERVNLSFDNPECTFGAQANDGYHFVGWFEGVLGDDGFINDFTGLLLSSDQVSTFDLSSESLYVMAVFEKNEDGGEEGGEDGNDDGENENPGDNQQGEDGGNEEGQVPEDGQSEQGGNDDEQNIDGGNNETPDNTPSDGEVVPSNTDGKDKETLQWIENFQKIYGYYADKSHTEQSRRDAIIKALNDGISKNAILEHLKRCYEIRKTSPSMKEACEKYLSDIEWLENYDPSKSSSEGNKSNGGNSSSDSSASNNGKSANTNGSNTVSPTGSNTTNVSGATSTGASVVTNPTSTNTSNPAGTNGTIVSGGKISSEGKVQTSDSVMSTVVAMLAIAAITVITILFQKKKR